MNPDSEQVLNRFASGELSVQEENDFLAFCEMDPSRYRRAMLAVVEQRRIEDALQAFALPEEPHPPEQPASPVTNPRKGLDPERNDERLPRPGSIPTRNLALAASLVVVAVGGYLLGGAGRSGEPRAETTMIPEPTTPQPVAPQLASAPQDTIGSKPDAAMMVSQDNHRDAPEAIAAERSRPGSLAGVLVDLVRSAQQQPVFNERARERLQQQGWEVDEEPEIYLIRTDDGHQYAVPTQNANIRFISQ